MSSAFRRCLMLVPLVFVLTAPSVATKVNNVNINSRNGNNRNNHYNNQNDDHKVILLPDLEADNDLFDPTTNTSSTTSTSTTTTTTTPGPDPKPPPSPPTNTTTTPVPDPNPFDPTTNTSSTTSTSTTTTTTTPAPDPNPNPSPPNPDNAPTASPIVTPTSCVTNASTCDECMQVPGCVFCDAAAIGEPTCVATSTFYPPCAACGNTNNCHRLTCRISAVGMFYMIFPISVLFPLIFIAFFCWHKRCCRKKKMHWRLENGLTRTHLTAKTHAYARVTYEDLYNETPPDAGFHDLHDQMRRKYAKKRALRDRGMTSPVKDSSDDDN